MSYAFPDAIVGVDDLIPRQFPAVTAVELRTYCDAVAPARPAVMR